ncbi:hypothetical protein ACQR1W_02845 [Bradyrhizobium sp. HKCCYLS1011]|uniref:hypothetical protein n=1 Tax=Bradyrhizobium sp. HKCCYLS1011 TaxID=3420733 RepID=UPI003EBEB62A
MNRFAIAMGLLIAVTAGPALAQSGAGRTGVSGSGRDTGSSASPSVEAPVGHRQPRASDFSNEKSLSDPSTPENKEDAALDRKIKSICRGC